MMPAALQGNRARCLIRMQRYEDAETDLLEAHAALVLALGEEHRRTQQVVRYAVELYESWEKPQESGRWSAMLATAAGG